MEFRVLSQPVAAWFLIPLFLCVLSVFAGALFWTEGISIAGENGFLENGQVIFLALAFGFSIRQVLRTEDDGVRLFHGVLGMLCLSVIVREIDIDRLGSATVWETTEFVIRLGVVAGWFFMGARVFRERGALWRLRMHFAPNSVLIVIAIIFYMLSGLFDHSASMNKAFSQLWEEILELNGTLFFLAASLRPLFS